MGDIRMGNIQSTMMSSAPASVGIEGHLTAILHVDPSAEYSCAVADTDASEGVSQNLVHLSEGTECRADVRSDSGETRFIKSPISKKCICPVLQRYDCVSSIESVEHGELVLSLSFPDRDELAKIIEGLRDTGATVRLQRITTSDDKPTNTCHSFEVETVTDKQREAVMVAIESGYYETPRGADLADLAEKLEISRSAVSQRLTAVESKLVTRLCETDRGKICCD